MDWLWVLIMTIRQASAEPADQWAVRLATLDDARSAAFATGDPDRLDDVYVAGSRPRAVDAATIRAYARRGGRVVGAELRVLSCRVAGASPDRATLEVVDVLAPAHVAWDDGTTTDLPVDRPSLRRVTMQRTADGWRMTGSVEISPR